MNTEPLSIKDRSERLVEERDILIRESFIEAKKQCRYATEILSSMGDSLLENGALEARKQIVARLEQLDVLFDNAFKSLRDVHSIRGVLEGRYGDE